MKKYNKPCLEVEKVNTTDIILTSGIDVVNGVFDYGDKPDEIF